MTNFDPSLVKWVFHTFDSLDTATLFNCLKLRVDVFVVEQACAYPELDNHDTAPDTLHLLGFAGTELAAYARAMPGKAHHTSGDDTDGKSVTIGRVVVAPAHRGTGVAQSLMRTLINRLDTDYPHHHQRLAAQEAVACFYDQLGFSRVSEVYLEDGIAHVDMVRRRSTSCSP